MGAKKKWNNQQEQHRREMVRHFDKEFVEIVFHWEINGKTYRKKKKRLYSRGRQATAFDLEQAAQIIFMWDKICDGGCTYGDEAIRDLAKTLPNESGLTEQQLFEKYWINTDATADQYLQEHAEQFIKYGYVNSFDEYLKYQSGQLMQRFSHNSLAVKQALLWFIFKYFENQSFDELKEEIAQIPQKISDMVDKLVDDSNKRQEENEKKWKDFTKPTTKS